MFETFSDNTPLPQRLYGAVVAIGNFDGVHRGHQAVIGETLSIAARENRPALVLTFEPHPRSFFQPDKPVFRLTLPPEKAVLFAALGLKGVVVKTFDGALAAMNAEEFVSYLADDLHAAHIVTGHDFHFGKGRSGTPDVLKTLSEKRGLQVTFVAPQNDEKGEAISSSSIRTALEAGDIEAANTLLGYYWFIEGDVQHGDKRGRVLGFPTANLALAENCRLKHGVYVARVRANGFWFAAAVHFGGRIQFGGGAPLLEAYLLDFSGDLYGQSLRVEFISHLRGEEKFETVEALVREMGRDVDRARALIAKAVTQPVSELQMRLETI